MMSFKTMSLLALVGLSQASPITSQTLEHDDVLVLRDGKALVMKSWDYTLEEDKREVQRRKMGASVRDGPATKADRALEALKARGCDESTEVQVLTDTHFNDWDVAMSPVIGNTGSSVATIAVAEGYSIADSVSVRLISWLWLGMIKLLMRCSCVGHRDGIRCAGESAHPVPGHRVQRDLDDDRDADLLVQCARRPVRRRGQQPLRPPGHGQCH